MTALFEMRIRLGGDPRDFNEFKALHQELGKLSHPACPDVDWLKLEELCLRLFELNGVELQTAVAFIMARSYRTGLAGMREGLALLAVLVEEWPRLWPAQVSARLDLLAWLFAQLQPLLRAVQWSPASLPALNCLAAELGRLERQLGRLAHVPVATLQALRSHVELLIPRLAGNSALGIPVQQWANVLEPAFVTPVAMQPLPQSTYTFVVEPQAKRRSVVFWLVGLLAVAAIAGGFGWQQWLRMQPRSAPEPVQLESLSLFDAGSAELRPGSTRLLVKALVGIKAKPGWLIVIAGHADASGDSTSNLELSRARAAAVRDWMMGMGDIPDSCFAVQGFAASQPLSSNDTQSGRAENRRVDIRLVPQVGACAELEAGLAAPEPL
ncbi:OmpA family protein [Pseudomonas putida]